MSNPRGRDWLDADLEGKRLISPWRATGGTSRASRPFVEIPGSLPREATQLRLRAVGVLDEHGEGIERLTQLCQRHTGALQELPEPSNGGALGVLWLAVADQEGDAKGVSER